jgi:hypothetical protein
MRLTPVPSASNVSTDLSEDRQRQKDRDDRLEKQKESSKAATIKIGGGGSGSAGVYTRSGKYEPIKYNKGGNVSTASKRADGCAIRGKTKA